MSVSVPDETDAVAELWQALFVPCESVNGKVPIESILESFWKNLNWSSKERTTWVPLEPF